MPPLPSTKKIGNILKFHTTSKDNISDLPLRNYKYLNYIDLNLTLHPINSILKSKIFRSLQTSTKILRKFKIDDDNDTEPSLILKPFYKILKHNSQTLTSLSNYILNDDPSLSSKQQLRHFLRKLKSLTKYKSFSTTSRDLNLVQTHLKSLDLVSSKFSKNDFKKAVSYLLSHKSNYPTLKELYLTFRLSRERENILDLLPVVLQTPKLKQIRLALLYAKNLPNLNNVPKASRAKVKELALLIDDSHSVTKTIPNILTFYNLESLSISNPFRGFSVNPDNYANWKALERFTNLKKFSLELSDDTRDVESLAMLLAYLSLPDRLEVLKLCFRYFPFESIVERYYGCLEKFAQGVKNLINLLILNLTFESEKSRRINEVAGLFDLALKGKSRLKEVCIGFPEPRYQTHGARCHGVLDISRLLVSLNGSADTLETLEIHCVKGEMKELRENLVKFTNLKKVKIGVDDSMNESGRLGKFLEILPEEKLRILELNLKTYVALEDVLTLARFKRLENFKISILGEVLGNYISTLRSILLNSKELKEILLEFPQIDIREENKVEELVMVLMNKKEIRRINVKTKYLKYAFDGNLDGRTKEQSNEHRKMIRFVH